MNWKAIGRIVLLGASPFIVPGALFYVLFALGTVNTAIGDLVTGNGSASPWQQLALAVTTIACLLLVLYGLLRNAMAVAREVNGVRRRTRRKRNRPF